MSYQTWRMELTDNEKVNTCLLDQKSTKSAKILEFQSESMPSLPEKSGLNILDSIRLEESVINVN